MKIVLTVHQFFPSFAAGTEVLTLSTAKELMRRGHEVVIWTGHPSDEQNGIDRYEHAGIPVYRYHHDRMAANPMETEYRNADFETYFREFLREYRPDVVHHFHLGRVSATAIEAAVSERIPVVFTATDFWFVCPTNQLRLPDNSTCMGPDRHSLNCLRHLVAISQSPAVNKWVERVPDWALIAVGKGTLQNWWPDRRYSPLVAALLRRREYLERTFQAVDRVIVPTAIMQEMLLKHGIRSEQLILQPYGIQTGELAQAPPKRTSDRLRIGFIGTLSEHKGAHVLVEAVKQLPKDAPLEVRIYGKKTEFPSYVERLQKEAAGDSRIRFCGTFPNEQIGDVFADLDVLAIPSIWYENTPLVMHSAQAASTPVIATNLGGMSEVIEHDHNGLLFEKEDATGMARQIRRLLEEPDLQRRLAANARKPKSMALYAEELEQLYEQILMERKNKK